MAKEASRFLARNVAALTDLLVHEFRRCPHLFVGRPDEQQMIQRLSGPGKVFALDLVHEDQHQPFKFDMQRRPGPLDGSRSTIRLHESLLRTHGLPSLLPAGCDC